MRPTVFRATEAQQKDFGMLRPTYMIASDSEGLFGNKLFEMTHYSDDLGDYRALHLLVNNVPVIIYRYAHHPEGEMTISVSDARARELDRSPFDVADDLLEILGLDKERCVRWRNEDLANPVPTKSAVFGRGTVRQFSDPFASHAHKVVHPELSNATLLHALAQRLAPFPPLSATKRSRLRRERIRKD